MQMLAKDMPVGTLVYDYKVIRRVDERGVRAAGAEAYLYLGGVVGADEAVFDAEAEKIQLHGGTVWVLRPISRRNGQEESDAFVDEAIASGAKVRQL